MALIAPATVTPVPQTGGILHRWVREGSLEVSDADSRELAGARELLPAGQRVFVSHLPGQSWTRTLELCGQLARAGFEPVPHIPVRLLRSHREFSSVLRDAREAGVREPLLIAGDYATVAGPYPSVLDALRTLELPARGFARVSFAGHPEGHPAVPVSIIRQAQIDKWRAADSMGLDVTFVTQFFFTADAFAGWARDLRAAGVGGRLVAGIAGPVGLGRLVRLAARCGVGASVRTLTARASAAVKLLADHDPGTLLHELATGGGADDLPDGIHVFSFGGLRRTAEWLRRRATDPGDGG